MLRRHGLKRHRPLLLNTDPATRLAELMAIREPLYRAIAHVVVQTDRRKVQSVAEHILEALGASPPAAGDGP